MVLTFDPSTDFEDVADGLEAVTLDRRGKANTSITNALQRLITTTEAAVSDGKYTQGDTRWHFPVVECTVQPALGDVIEDGNGDRWTILDVSERTLSKRWACSTRNLAVVYGLNDTLVIEKATYAKGTAGAAEATYTVWRTGVQCRIQETSRDVEVTAGAKRAGRQYDVFLGEDVTIDHNHRLRDAKGNYYRVENITGAEEIGGLQTVSASEWRA
jgi:hypothetical protein